MARQQISLKQLAIDKDNTTIVIAVALAVFITIFSLVASKSLLGQSAYQSKVIKKKQVAYKQLKKNADEVKKLDASYQMFASQQQNIIAGNSAGNGDRDGDNAQIILDALPSKYDFPALATSLQKAFRQYKLDSISGTDDELTQAAVKESSTPAVAEIPFTIELSASAETLIPTMQVFERSIRPIQISKLSLTGGDGDDIKLNVTAKTYFQPPKTFNITSEKVK